jgi:hypothetical protein
MHRINIHANINRVGLEALSFRRCDQSIPFRSSRMGTNPLLSQIQITGKSDRIPVNQSRESLACTFFFAVEQCLDEGRNVLGPKRPHGYSEMQAVIEARIL